MTKASIHTLFSDVVMKVKMDLDEDLILDLYNKQKWQLTQNNNLFTQITEDFYVLKKHKEIQNKFLEKFNTLKNDVLKYEAIDCKISTSWFTKTEPDMLSSIHNHANSLFSCVYYFKNESTSVIGFEQDNQFMLDIKPSEYNNFNHMSDLFFMENDYAIFFPSYLKHQIKLNKTKHTRKSLALNFIPTFFNYNKKEAKIMDIR